MPLPCPNCKKDLRFRVFEGHEAEAVAEWNGSRWKPGRRLTKWGGNGDGPVPYLICRNCDWDGHDEESFSEHPLLTTPPKASKIKDDGFRIIEGKEPFGKKGVKDA